MKGLNPFIYGLTGSFASMTVVKALDGQRIVKGKVISTTVTNTELNVPRKSNFANVVKLGKLTLPFLRLYYKRRKIDESSYNAFIGDAMNKTIEINGIPQSLDFTKVGMTRGDTFQPVVVIDIPGSVSTLGVVSDVEITWGYNPNSVVQEGSDRLGWIIVSEDFEDYNFAITSSTRGGSNLIINTSIDKTKSYLLSVFFVNTATGEASTSFPIARINVANGVVEL